MNAAECKLVWAHPSILTPPHKVTKPEQLWELAVSMADHGWVGDALVGYLHEGGVQLLSGTHRRASAMLAALDSIPVVVWTQVAVESAWGTPYWTSIMTSGARYGIRETVEERPDYAG